MALTEKAAKRNVVLVGLLSFFGGISQDVFAPILPIYLSAVLGFDKTFIGIAEGLVTAGGDVFAVISGYLSDRFRRQKPLIFLGYLLSMVSRPLLALVSAGTAVLGLRFMDGVGKGVKDPPKDVLIAGSAKREVRGRGFGIARMLDTLGSVAGPLILFVLLWLLKGTALTYHWILGLSAVPLLFTLLILVLGVRETQSPPDPSRTRAPSAALPGAFYVFLGIVVLFTLGNSSDAFLILRARSVGVTLLEIPLVIALFNLVYALLAVPLGALSDRIGRIPTMLMGWMVYALVYLGFGHASTALSIWPLYACYGIFYAANLGVVKAFLADLVGVDFRGRAFGIYGMTVGAATFGASFIAGALWDRMGPQAPFYFGGGMALAASVCLMVASGMLRRASTNS